MKLARLAGLGASADRDARAAALDASAPDDLRELAVILAEDWRASKPRFVGLGGGQGAGKSTLGRLIEAACAQVGVRACVIGIDDFYKTKQERVEMADRVHPLFETRGPPGTHDVAACRGAMQSLCTAGPTELPCFDKGLDDRIGSRVIDGPLDLVVLEGWCVGAQAVPAEALARPINVLEREEDAEGRWRCHMNVELAGAYQSLYRELDQIVFLAVPDLSAVRRWRLQQEEALPAERRLDERAIDRFVAHYERVTLDMLRDLPDRADWTVRLAPDHSVVGLDRSTASKQGG